MKETDSESDRKVFTKIYSRILERLEEFKVKNVLDAGCEEGKLTMMLVENGYEAEACDIDVSRIKSKFKCKKCDLNDVMPYEDNSFDCVLAVEVIEHLANPFNLLKEMHRVLKPNGVAILTTPNILNIWSRIKFLVKGDLYLFDRNVDLSRGSVHISPFTYYHLEKMAKYIGFKIIDVEGVGNLRLVYGGIKSIAAKIMSYTIGLFLSRDMINYDNVIITIQKVDKK
jgi:2-polyprenyl-3-methyl-5-hydroxy-6-metoxy-1,4-benzoquinol methylase